MTRLFLAAIHSSTHPLAMLAALHESVHAVVYEYGNGTRLHATCRQQSGCMNEISAHVFGAKGRAAFGLRSPEIVTDKRWAYEGEKNVQQQTEHDELFASIRDGKPINNGAYMARSTLMAIMGRMATYTGQAVTEEASNSKENLSPERHDWNAAPPEARIAVPGVTKLV